MTTDTTETDDAPIGFLDPDDAFTRRFASRPAFASFLDRIDAYDLPETDLAAYPGIVISSQVDQVFLYRHRDRIRSYLAAGGVIAFSGHLARPWLPGAGCFEPKTIESHDDYTVVEARPHPVFDGVDLSDLTAQRGVAGFFARGHNPPPDHATVLLRLADGEPIVYVDDRTTAGTIFAHSGNDLITLGRRSSTAARIPRQLAAWMRSQSAVGTGASTDADGATGRDEQ